MVLAGIDAFEPAVSVLGFSIESCRRLDALPFMIQAGRFEQLKPEHAGRVLIACNKVPPLRESVPHIAELARYRASIDPGEALLLAHLVARPDSLLLSGDKRWMRTFGSPELVELRQAIAGRVICLERLVFLLIDRLGIRSAAKLLTPARPMNQTLKVLFSNGEKTSETHCREGLQAYMRELESLLGEDFFWQDS